MKIWILSVDILLGYFPEQTNRIGRALGPTKYTGNVMAQNILQPNSIVVPRRTVNAIPSEHLSNQVLQDKMKFYYSCVKEKSGDSMRMPVERSTYTTRMDPLLGR